MATWKRSRVLRAVLTAVVLGAAIYWAEVLLRDDRESDSAGKGLEPDTPASIDHGHGDALWARGDWKSVVGGLTHWVVASPSSPAAHCSLGWFLATCPAATIRDSARAIPHATEACELTNWADSDCLDVLAAAYAEAGDFGAACEWQRMALLVDSPQHYDRAAGQSRLYLYEQGLPFREQPTNRRLFDRKMGSPDYYELPDG